MKESTLRQHAGWTLRSSMPEKYPHYFGNESSESILEAYGLKPKDKDTEIMTPKQCPNCKESNKPDSKFCGKCRLVLSYDAYSETIEEKEQKHSEIKSLHAKYEGDMKLMRDEMNRRFTEIISVIQDNPKLTAIKPEILVHMKEGTI